MTPPPPTPLSDGVVLLRPVAEDDVPAIVMACQDPEIPRWTRVPSPYTEADARWFVEQSRLGWEEDRSWSFAITAVPGGELLGVIGLRPVEENGQIGYWVAREARGRGVATRALRLLSDFGLERFDRLQLLTEPENEASKRVAERAGFRREGLLRSFLLFKGRRRDAVMWGLVRGDR